MKHILSFYRLAFKLLRESAPYVLVGMVLSVFLSLFFGSPCSASRSIHAYDCRQSKILYGVPPSQQSFFRKVVSFLYGIAEIIFWGYLFVVIVVLLIGGFFKDVLFFVYFLLYCLFAPFILGVLHLLSLKYSDNLPPSDSLDPIEEEYF